MSVRPEPVVPAPQRPRPARPPRRGPRWVPPQHGAWAMLLVPFAVGLLPSWGGRVVWWHLPLLVAWLSGYLFSYFAFLAVKTGRPGRVRPQLLAYGTLAAAAGAPVVVARPAVLLTAPVFAVLLAVNAAAARHRADRSLGNDLASVVQACLVTPVVALVAQVPVAPVLGAGLAAFLYLAGTVPYVKTMIRERDDPRYLRGSIAYHVVALGVATWLSPWLAVPFALYLARAVVLPRRRGTTVRQVGLVEVACSLLLVAVLALPR